MAADVSGVFADKALAAQHLLLFVSALIPKAMASLLTSAVIELSKSKNVSGVSHVVSAAWIPGLVDGMELFANLSSITQTVLESNIDLLCCLGS